jgi:hypothetical protein
MRFIYPKYQSIAIIMRTMRKSNMKLNMVLARDAKIIRTIINMISI